MLISYPCGHLCYFMSSCDAIRNIRTTCCFFIYFIGAPQFFHFTLGKITFHKVWTKRRYEKFRQFHDNFETPLQTSNVRRSEQVFWFQTCPMWMWFRPTIKTQPSSSDLMSELRVRKRGTLCCVYSIFSAQWNFFNSSTPRTSVILYNTLIPWQTKKSEDLTLNFYAVKKFQEILT